MSPRDGQSQRGCSLAGTCTPTPTPRGCWQRARESTPSPHPLLSGAPCKLHEKLEGKGPLAVAKGVR